MGIGMETYERIRDGQHMKGKLPSDTRGYYDYGPKSSSTRKDTGPKTKAETREERLRQKLRDQWRQKTAQSWARRDPTDKIKRSDGVPW